MKSALVDTTVVYDQLLGTSKRKAAAVAAVASYDDSRTVAYAFRELRAGALGTWILAYNTISEFDTIEEAVIHLQRIGHMAPRKGQVSVTAIVRALDAALQAPKVPEQPPRDAVLAFLGEAIVSAWNGRKVTAKRITNALPCFLQDDLVLDAGRLRTKSTHLGCQPSVACGAAMHLKDRASEVKMLVNALRPPKAGSDQKRELARMRVALKEVLSSSKGQFSRKLCRSLGDAYFCVMADSHEDIVTTNKGDFALLTGALKKNVVGP